MHPSSEIDTIIGRVQRVVYAHPAGYRVIRLTLEPTNARVTAVGNLMDVHPGQRLELQGKWVIDKRFGRQFKTSTYRELYPESRRGIEKYLASEFKGIGPKLAGRIVAKFGKKTLEIIEETPDKIGEVDGIGREKLQRIIEQWRRKRSLAEASVFLGALDLGPATIQKVLAKYSYDTMNMLQENPYRLATEINGVGFLTADRLAGQLAIPGDSPVRIRATITYELNEARGEGHCCLPLQEVLERVKKRIQQPIPRIKDEMELMLDASEIVRISHPKAPDLIFSAALNRLERELAFNLNRIAKNKKRAIQQDLRQMYHREMQAGFMVANPEQFQAVEMVRDSRIMVITGGPGTGKTTILRLILKALHGFSVKLASPTGRAAQRLQESTGCPAKTIHRLLEYSPQNNFFAVNSRRKLDAEAVIIDESSMLDLELAAALIRALPDHCRLIMVGDVDQLPSVGPGRVLSDLIHSDAAQVIRLKHIFRQKRDSRIVSNAHGILNGKMPQSAETGQGGDFFVIARDDPEQVLSVIQKLPFRIAGHINVDPLKDVQVLAPMYRGSLGVNHLNEMLRELLNPGKPQIQVGTRIFRIGDKVMQIRNNYDLDIFNGDVGFITGINTNRSITLRFGDRELAYPADSMDQLAPSFACTIHKSQGSEYPGVIIPVHTQHYLMLRQQLFYTAVTRGKQMVVVVGSRKAMAMAVRNDERDIRHSLLRQRFNALFRSS